MSFCANQLNVIVVFTGQHYTVQEAEEIFDSACKQNDDLISEWCDMVNSKTTPRPVFPLPIFPRVTPYCVSAFLEISATTCGIGLEIILKVGELMLSGMLLYLFPCSSFSFFILAAAPEHPYFVPCEMMQV